MGQVISYLKGENLQKVYNKRPVVSDVSVQVAQGSVVGLLGPNGAGKTTVFYMLVGLVAPDSGKIYIDDKDVSSQPLHERARSGLAYLPQESSLFRKMTVLQNVSMALEARGFKGAELEDRANILLKKFGLEKVRFSAAAALSGGERRRCEIARCLAIDPRFVLLDEPFAGIDPIAVSEIQSYIQELKSQGIGVLITDHNVRETLGSCDHGYLMKEGQIFFYGTPQDISENAEARKFYLGESFRLD